MILERPYLTFVIPALCLALGIAIASFEVSPRQNRDITTPLNQVATITTTEGRVELSRYHTPYSSRLPKGKNLEISLFNFDKVQTHITAKTRVTFLDGFVIEFLPRSLFVLEQWSPDENQGPIYINLLKGDYRIIKSGRRGSLYFVKDGVIFAPNKKPKKKFRVLTVRAITPIKNQLEVQTKPEEPKTEIVKTAPPLIETLSNQYIDQTIARNRDQLVKCQTHAIRQDKASKGQLLVGLSIEPRGQMKEVRILASDIENDELQNCIKSVLQRTKFRPFKGSEIVRSYPLIFE